MKKLIAIFILILLGNAASARILNVPSEYPTIQAGIDASVSGDTVLVAPGEYRVRFSVSGKNILLSTSSGPETTVIIAVSNYIAQVDSNCVISGFSFRAHDIYTNSLMVLTSDASPKIEGNIFERNFFVAAGGAIDCFGGNPLIRGNIIRNNQTMYNGGGISLEGIYDILTSHAEISYNIIYRNNCATGYGGGRGGGIYLAGDATIKYNVIYENTASNIFTGGGYGGGIYKTGTSSAHKTVIVNNTIINNAAILSGAPSIGGGIYIPDLLSTDTLIVKNNLIAFNNRGGNVITNPNNPAVLFWDYNLIFGDTVSTFPHGEQDIFVDPLLADTASDDYHLLPGSPCIDAGDPLSPFDPDSTRADIGALFFNQSVDIDNPGEPSGPYAFELHQNYPNPFNGETIISYYLPQQAKVGLRIYDMTGRIIQTLARGEIQAAGGHKHRWDGADTGGRAVSTGIYLYELTVDGQRQAKTLIILK